MKEKNSSNIVKKIPGNLINSQTINLDVRSYSGYAETNINNIKGYLFYWLFESQEFSPQNSGDEEKIGKTPLVIWLNGGPGASSTLGLFLENGPYRIDQGALGELKENPFTWNQNTHIMYWDQPFGTGYSYAKNSKGELVYVKDEDELTEIFYHALLDFYSKYPQYKSCPLYITGESYGGKYIPNIASKIHSKNIDKSNTTKINLKGIAIGDGWINPELQIRIYIDYAYTLGFIDTLQKQSMDKDYARFCKALQNKEWKNAYLISNNIVDNVSALGGNFNVYDIRAFADLSMDNIRAYMQLPEVKEALHVPKNQEWNCADNNGPVAENLIEDNMIDSSYIYSKITQHTDLYKVLMYTATFDTACGSMSTENILYNLKKWDSLSDDEWRKLERKIWAQPASQVKGFVKQFKNLTQVVLPNSGHEVPYYLPKISREMLYRWINGTPFPSYTPSLKK